MGFLVQVPVTDQNWKVVLVAGEVPGHLQSTAEVPLSSLANAQMLREPVWGSLLTLLSPLPQYMRMCVHLCLKKMVHVFVIIKRVCNWISPCGTNKVYLILIYRSMRRPFAKQSLWHKMLPFNSEVKLNLDLRLITAISSTCVCHTTVHHVRIAAIKLFTDRYSSLSTTGAEYVVFDEEVGSLLACYPASLFPSSDWEVPILY